ncbi:MAG: GNAT family N-acetyltransferase [Myxococcota bacterium]
MSSDTNHTPAIDEVCLHSDGLELRPHRAEDFTVIRRLWTHPKIVERFGGKERPPAEIWRRLLAYRGHWSLFGWGYWVVRERKSGVFVGELGFGDLRRGISELEGSPEAGWSLNPEFHGRGYAREAMELALEWLASERGVTRTVCMVTIDNEPSLKLAARLGYRRFGGNRSPEFW